MYTTGPNSYSVANPISPKEAIPSTTILLFRGGRGAISKEAYPDLEAFYEDIAAATGTNSSRSRTRAAATCNSTTPSLLFSEARADLNMTMTMTMTDGADARTTLAELLQNYSVEVTARDHKSVEAAGSLLRPGAEVFITAIPGESADRLVAAAVQLRRAGLVPVPHVVARNIESRKTLDDLLGRLVAEAKLDRALVLGGDRDKPAGEFDSSLQLIATGLLQKHGIGKIALACYPEGHPRIADATLEAARAAKLAAAEAAGLDVTLVSQFCFDPRPIIALAERMRRQGVRAPFRVGVAGPAERMTLVKYALMCGVGASMRALKERQDLARNVLTGETPEALLSAVALARARNPALGIAGVHFFTFGSLGKSAQWANAHLS